MSNSSSMPGFPDFHHLPEFAQTLPRWVSDASTSSAAPFSFCLQTFPAPVSFLMSWLFGSGSQSIGTWALASVLPVNSQDWFPLGLTGLISLQSEGFSSLLLHHTLKASVLQCSAFFMVQLSQLCVLVAQLCPILRNPTACSPPGSSVHGISQARILEWIAISFSKGYPGPRSPELEADSLLIEPPGKPPYICTWLLEKLQFCPFTIPSLWPLRGELYNILFLNFLDKKDLRPFKGSL